MVVGVLVVAAAVVVEAPVVVVGSCTAVVVGVAVVAATAVVETPVACVGASVERTAVVGAKVDVTGAAVGFAVEEGGTDVGNGVGAAVGNDVGACLGFSFHATSKSSAGQYRKAGAATTSTLFQATSGVAHAAEPVKPTMRIEARLKRVSVQYS